MTTTRALRKAAFQLLYQLGAAADVSDDVLLASLDELELSDKDRQRVLDLAKAAFACREQADVVMTELAPTWPTARQPAVDRAILRLAYYEMTASDTPPKAVVNDAVEIAKLYSTEKSPAFINGLLDKVLRQVLHQSDEPSSAVPSDLASDSFKTDHNESCPS